MNLLQRAELSRMYDLIATELLPGHTKELLAHPPRINIAPRGRKKKDSWYASESWTDDDGSLIGEITIASEVADDPEYIFRQIVSRSCEHAMYLKHGHDSPTRAQRLRDAVPAARVKSVYRSSDIRKEAFVEFRKKDLAPDGKKKQKTRMLLWECACGIKVRSTRDLSRFYHGDCATYLERK